ncbi:MAG: tyrosine-type recombinase/integrase [Sumerlaeia bacterium]
MKDRHLIEALREFATFLRVERNLAPKTREAYAYDLARFCDFLVAARENRTPLRATADDRRQAEAEQARLEAERPKLKLSDATTGRIQDYLAHLHDDLGYKAATLGRTVSSIRGLMDWCVEAGWLDRSPARDIHPPKMPKKLPIYLIEDEIRRLLNAPDPTTYIGRRDQTILLTLAYTGLRLQELVGLNTLDADFSRDTLRVMGKGSKERLVPMNAVVRDALAAHLADTERQPVHGERAIFLNTRGSRLTGRAVQYMVDKYVELAGIEKERVSPHKLRHSFATLLHSKDVDLVDIQALMGHASLASTQIYTHTNAGRLQSAVDRLNGLMGGSGE